MKIGLKKLAIFYKQKYWEKNTHRVVDKFSTNICGKKMKESGFQFRWTFEEAIKDWFLDNNNQFLE